jgi:hypothetical protein
MTIFDGLDQIIDSYLGIDGNWVQNGIQLHYGHHDSLIQLCQQRPGVDYAGFIRSLVTRVHLNWDQADQILKENSRPEQNWRRRKKRFLYPRNQDSKVTLERTIAKVTDDNWWNSIPVEQTLLGVWRGEKVDLVHRDGDRDRDLELIELNVGPPKTPLSAAGQLLKYAAIYHFIRSRYEEIFGESRPLQLEFLRARQMTFVVLGPWSSYEAFATCTWLADFETSLDFALGIFSTLPGTDLPHWMFRLETFPRDFSWTADMAWDRAGRDRVLWAVNHRERVFERVGNNTFGSLFGDN